MSEVRIRNRMSCFFCMQNGGMNNATSIIVHTNVVKCDVKM